jgi:4-hydroxy-tetrahydrodipicolinate reductase
MATLKKLALVGYGKMGKLVDQLAPEYGFEVVARIRRKNEQVINADVAIEFSTPEAAVDNLLKLSKSRIPTVCGTTGWFDSLPQVAAAIEKDGSALVWSPNFSVGVAVFRKLTERAAKLLKEDPAYGAWAWEIHHDAKKDAPSGTLQQLIAAMHEGGYSRHIDVSSNRAGRHPGTHEIGFDSAADTITLRHVARSREGFARGALQSAAWIQRKKGVFTFDDVLFGKETLD